MPKRTKDTPRRQVSYLGGIGGLTAEEKLLVYGALQIAGGTMEGALVLSGAPTIDLHAATKKYVDDMPAGAHAPSHEKDGADELDAPLNILAIPDLETSKIIAGVFDLARIPTIPLSTKVSEHDLTRHPLAIIPTMDLAHIPTPLTGKDADTLDGDHLADLKLRPVLTFAVTGALETGTDQAPTILVPYAMTIIKVKVVVKTAPTGSSIIVDVNKNGTTIFTTQGNRPEIAIDGTIDDSGTPDITALAENDKVTVDIDQIGSGTAGADLTVEIVCEVGI